MSEERDSTDSLLDSGDTVVPPPPAQPAATPHASALYAGRYELLAKVGHGGMGTVYRARDTLVGDVVALKTLDVGQTPRPDLLERFRREVRLARRISHPHVARTHDLGEHEGHLFLTMEFVEGEDLQSLLRRERALAPARAARFGLAVCEGLAAAHAADVVHRDLKPANVLLDARGRVVLTDFGIARAVAGETASRTQGLVGTPMYIAPEQLAGGEVDARADLYAVGLLLYEMLTGETAFTGDSPMAVAFARLRQPPPDPRARGPVPDALAELVLRCLSREPEGRPAGAHEVAVALGTWLTSVGEPLVVPGLTTPVPGASYVTGSTPLPSPSASTVLSSQPGPDTSRTGRVTTQRPGALELAVLPPRFMGPREQDFLADALAEGLIDVLSRTRGLRVQGSGATARFRNERDPRVVGRELGVGFVVDGTVQSLGSAVRASLRLVEVSSGIQLWSGRFEDSGEDVFALQDRLAQRMAEALRQELLIVAYRDAATPELVALYRQALAQLHSNPRMVPEGVIQPLEQCIEQAPGFLPAVGLHAAATLRGWFMRSVLGAADWEAQVHASLERASRLAPELADTHLARAMLATQKGDMREAVVSLRAALNAAPTFAWALLYLGNLQCEAGRADEGLERLRLAYALEPSMSLALHELSRCSALRGRMDDYRWGVERMASQPLLRLPMLLLRIRVGAWTGDLEEVRRCRDELRDEAAPMAVDACLYASVMLGELEPEKALEPVDALLAGRVNPRFASLLCQFATEEWCSTGHLDRALPYLQRAADTALIDMEWLERCPALASLRTTPGFTEARRKVRARVESLWAA